MPEARPSDMNDFIGIGTKGQTIAFCAPETAPANMPANFQYKTRFYAIVYNSTGTDYAYDICQRIVPRSMLGNSYERYRTGTEWSEWKEISTDIPAFYKNYADLASLKVAVAQKYTGTLSKNGGTKTITTPLGGIATFSEASVDGISVQFMYGYNADSDTTKGLVILHDPASAVGRLITITKAAGYSITITNISTTKDMDYTLTVT